MKKRQRKVKIRRTWGDLRPVTKVKQSKKIYSRKRDRCGCPSCTGSQNYN